MKSDIVVVDASVAVKWVVEEDNSHIAIELLMEWKRQNKSIIVPALFVYEMTNILFKKVRRGKIPLNEAKEAISSILAMEIEVYWSINPDLSIHGLELASTHKLPATYDAHYLALAEREGCEFWTADARLYHAVREQLAWVRLMADDPAASTPA